MRVVAKVPSPNPSTAIAVRDKLLKSSSQERPRRHQSAPGGHLPYKAIVVLDNASAITAFDNTVTGNLMANGNTGLLDVVGNSVGGSLQCRNNPDLIMGGGNKARRIIGQCN
jgi:hypothetical protein